MIEEFYLISVVLVYAAIGAMMRALFGLYKAYNNTADIRMFSFNWRRVMLEVCVSIILGTFGVVIITEAGGMGLSFGSKSLALLGGLFGPDILTFITKKIGITKAFDIKFTDEQVELAAFNPRQANAMKYLKDNGRITNTIYQRLNHTTHSIAAKDLAQMVTMKKLEKSGIGKATCYVLV
jgi:hypothetical protein